MIRERIILVLNKIKAKDIFVFVLISCIILLSWHPFLSNDFINDDFQILGWLKPNNFTDTFKPFLEKEPILFYWRPIVNFLNALTIFLFGFHPLPFLIQNFIVYSLICLIIFKIFKYFNISNGISIIGTSLFSVLPSHDLPIAWIACRYDLFMTLFILLATYSYLSILFSRKNNYIHHILLVLFSLLAVFSKEHSFILIGFGILMYFVERKKIRIHISFTFLILCIIAAYFVLRLILIGGSPFSSSNFSDINFLDFITNYFLYILTSLIHPELFLNFVQFKEIDFVFIAQLVLVFIIFIYFIYFITLTKDFKSTIFNSTSPEYAYVKLSFFGILFYTLSVIPVLPLYMRWYSFFPFIGIIFFLTGFLGFINISLEKIKGIFVLRGMNLLLILFMFLSIFYNYSQAQNWNFASKEVTGILKSLRNLEISEAETLTLWGIPDKIEGISTMKLGVEQAVHHALENKKINVKAPLRFECNREYSSNIKNTDHSTYIITLKGGILRHQFSERFNIEKIKFENDEYYLNINNNPNHKDKNGNAVLIFKRRNSKNIDLFWTGKEFLRF